MVIAAAGLIPALLCHNLKADPRVPADPVIPDVSIRDSDYGREALVSFEGGGVRSFYLLFPSRDFTVSDPSRRQRTVSIDEVRTFRIRRWKRIRRNREMVFVPEKVEITLKDGTVLQGDSTLDMLRKIPYRTDTRSGYLYTMFYDYWQKNRWINSGSNDRDYPLEHPAKGTVTEIRFDRAESRPGLLDFLGKSLDKRGGE